MILSDSISPVQLKVFSRIADLYRDQKGRTIARKWPTSPHGTHPNTQRTAARIARMHACIKGAPRTWHTPFNSIALPFGRSAEDLKRQVVLWLLNHTNTPPLVGLSFISRLDNQALNTSTTILDVDPLISWDFSNTQLASYTHPTTSTLALTWEYSNQLFRRGTPALLRPIESFPLPLALISPTAGPGSNQLTLITPLLGPLASCRPFWTTGPAFPQSAANASCYPRPPWPIPITPPIPINPPTTIMNDEGLAWSQWRVGGSGKINQYVYGGFGEMTCHSHSTDVICFWFACTGTHIRITYLSNRPDSYPQTPLPMTIYQNTTAPNHFPPSIRQGVYPYNQTVIGSFSAIGDSITIPVTPSPLNATWFAFEPTCTPYPYQQFQFCNFRMESLTLP